MQWGPYLRHQYNTFNISANLIFVSLGNLYERLLIDLLKRLCFSTQWSYVHTYHNNEKIACRWFLGITTSDCTIWYNNLLKVIALLEYQKLFARTSVLVSTYYVYNNHNVNVGNNKQYVLLIRYSKRHYHFKMRSMFLLKWRQVLTIRDNCFIN